MHAAESAAAKAGEAVQADGKVGKQFNPDGKAGVHLTSPVTGQNSFFRDIALRIAMVDGAAQIQLMHSLVPVQRVNAYTS